MQDAWTPRGRACLLHPAWQPHPLGAGPEHHLTGGPRRVTSGEHTLQKALNGKARTVIHADETTLLKEKRRKKKKKPMPSLLEETYSLQNCVLRNSSFTAICGATHLEKINR